jgi:hypothetical protein
MLKIIGCILLIFFSLLGVLGGMCIGIGELGSLAFARIILPIPFIIIIIMTMFYNKIYMNTKDKLIIILKFSILIFIMAVIYGFVYKVVEIDSIENKLGNAGNIVNEYRINNGIEYLSEDDFKNMNLNEKITIEIRDDGYTLSYKYGKFYYFYQDGKERLRVRRN